MIQVEKSDVAVDGVLPIAAFREQIVQSVRGNPVTIITAETGAGKSTQVPQYLLEEGYKIIVTQPRRLAARTLAERVAEDRQVRFGREVGYRTAQERQDSPDTRCLFVTDGLALVRELMGVGSYHVLVLDEVHEWNTNIEVLVAWAKDHMSKGANFRLVLMSATLEAEKLSAFFDSAPVISVPGRLFPIQDLRPQGREMLDDVAHLLSQGRNTLVFLSGKKEIADMVYAVKDAVSRQGFAAEVLPLHGDLDVLEQRKCFRNFPHPKCVISTNVAQTSVTIPDIDAVVDSGAERRVEVVNGVEGLYLRSISLADAKQRRGRAGRCKPGIYIDWCEDTCRSEFPTAEIFRVRLDQTVLRLAQAGYDMEELSFFHQPDIRHIHAAKVSLKALGCMDEKGRVTDIGRKVAQLPLSVQFGRMIVEAEKLGVVEDVVAAAVLMEGGITLRPRDGETPLWSKLCLGETESDVIAHLRVFDKAWRMSKGEMLENGILPKAFFPAKERYLRIIELLRQRFDFERSTEKREDILRAICAGMVEHLYQYDWCGWKNTEETRSLSRDSVVMAASGDWAVAIPFDLEITTRRGKQTLRLIQMVTKVKPEWLAEVAPQMARVEGGLKPSYDPMRDVCVSTTRVLFGDRVISEERVQSPGHPESSRVFAEWLTAQMVG